MKKNIYLILVTIFLISAVCINANAALYDRGSGLVYDDALNITWMQDANYTDGTMPWYDAINWANGLDYAGYNDWRLPTSDALCSGYNCVGSEMGHLFYADNINSESWGLFSNVESRVYWSATEVAGDNNMAWRFNFNDSSGYQGKSAKIYDRGVWAVRDGDSPVAPEPASAVLFMFGALFIERAVFFKKRKK